MADLAYETGEKALIETLQALWEDLTFHKLYLTGGIGPSRANEGFTKWYDLPNREAYAETCAAIGLVFWSHRMLHLDLNSRYADVMERALYNGMLSGVALSGDRFFYENPLESDGRHHRQRFFTCSCCPPNINRVLPTIGGYVYSQTQDQIAIHLFIQSQAEINLPGGKLILHQETDYPWDGIVCLRCEMEKPMKFILKIRQPGWCPESRLYLNEGHFPIDPVIDRGYFSIKRLWHPGDLLRLQFVMPATQVYAHPQVWSDVGRSAITRGPLVYCVEAVDQTVPASSLRLPRGVAFDSQFEPDILGGVVMVQTMAKAVDFQAWGEALYQYHPPKQVSIPIRAVPYFAWDNRSPGEMQVWLPEATS